MYLICFYSTLYINYSIYTVNYSVCPSYSNPNIKIIQIVIKIVIDHIVTIVIFNFTPNIYSYSS